MAQQQQQQYAGAEDLARDLLQRFEGLRVQASAPAAPAKPAPARAEPARDERAPSPEAAAESEDDGALVEIRDETTEPVVVEEHRLADSDVSLNGQSFPNREAMLRAIAAAPTSPRRRESCDGEQSRCEAPSQAQARNAAALAAAGHQHIVTWPHSDLACAVRDPRGGFGSSPADAVRVDDRLRDRRFVDGTWDPRDYYVQAFDAYAQHVASTLAEQSGRPEPTIAPMVRFGIARYLNVAARQALPASAPPVMGADLEHTAWLAQNARRDPKLAAAQPANADQVAYALRQRFGAGIEPQAAAELARTWTAANSRGTVSLGHNDYLNRLGRVDPALLGAIAESIPIEGPRTVTSAAAAALAEGASSPYVVVESNLAAGVPLAPPAAIPIGARVQRLRGRPTGRRALDAVPIPAHPSLQYSTGRV